MRLSTQEVEQIALLAHLNLSETQRETAAEELSKILTYCRKLDELDTENIEPTSRVLPAVNVLRDDVPRPSLSPAQALQNAPEAAADMFQVPRVVEAE